MLFSRPSTLESMNVEGYGFIVLLGLVCFISFFFLKKKRRTERERERERERGMGVFGCNVSAFWVHSGSFSVKHTIFHSCLSLIHRSR